MSWILRPIYIILLAATVSADECPTGFRRHEDSCYLLVRVKASWAEAAVYCSALGAHLAIVESDGEEHYIEAYLNQIDSTIDGEGVWISGLDYRKEGVWEYGFQRGPITKTWWLPGSPNNVHGGNTGQNCLMMYKPSKYGWTDNFCSVRAYFLCETEHPYSKE